MEDSIFNSPLGFLLMIAIAFTVLQGYAWLYSRIFAVSITERTLMRYSRIMRVDGKAMEGQGDLNGWTESMNNATTLAQAARIIEDTRNTDDPGDGAYA